MIDKLKAKILEKVDNQKPYSKWHFWLIEGGSIFLILGLLTLICFFLAFAIWDLLQTANIANPETFNFFNLIFKGLPELFLIAVILSIVIYCIYRQTDFPLVKNRLLLTTILLTFVISTTSLILVAVENYDTAQSSFESAQKSLDDSAYRPKRVQRFYEQFKIQGLVNGRIQRVERGFDTVSFTLINPTEKIDFIAFEGIFKDFKTGDNVSVRFDPNIKNKVLEIEPFQPKRGNIRGPRKEQNNSQLIKPQEKFRN